MDEGVKVLRQAAMHAQGPSREAVAAATRELRDAVAAVEESRGTDAGRARALAQLLDQALRYHAAHTTNDCPVCGTIGAPQRHVARGDDGRAGGPQVASRRRQTVRTPAWNAPRPRLTGCCECLPPASRRWPQWESRPHDPRSTPCRDGAAGHRFGPTLPRRAPRAARGHRHQRAGCAAHGCSRRTETARRPLAAGGHGAARLGAARARRR